MSYGTKINYKGYVLKSKIELAWARFFDSRRYAWEYEPVKFRGKNVGVYTPDFHLPDFGVFVETKPYDNIKANQWDLCTTPLLLVCGYPDHYYIRIKPAGTLGAFDRGHFLSWDRALAHAGRAA